MGEKQKAQKKERKKKKVGENNGQLRFVLHHGWRTQAHLDQNMGLGAEEDHNEIVAIGLIVVVVKRAF